MKLKLIFFLVVRAHRDQPERALAFLKQLLWKPGDIVEQLASRKELVTNRAVAEAATRLYFDSTTGAFKRGHSSKIKGGPRRLASLLNQLDLTWCLVLTIALLSVSPYLSFVAFVGAVVASLFAERQARTLGEAGLNHLSESMRGRFGAPPRSRADD